MSLQIRKAKHEELNRILEIYAYATRFMEDHGNKTQWAGDNAVTKEKLENLYAKEQLYVGVEAEEIQFVFAYVLGGDPTYDVIEDGQWLNEEPYAAIHRVASAGVAKGVVKTITEWALLQNNNLRIDTHHDNYVMQNALTNAGYTRCGIIHLKNGDPRIAYQKAIIKI